jgi:hypothetical protein
MIMNLGIHFLKVLFGELSIVDVKAIQSFIFWDMMPSRSC